MMDYSILNRPIYAFNYIVNDDTKRCRLISKPTLGEILKDSDSRLDKIPCPSWSSYVFVPYKKNTKTFRNSGIVSYESRLYADTLEEANRMYNELVNKRIDKLQEMIEEAKGDLV